MLWRYVGQCRASDAAVHRTRLEFAQEDRSKHRLERLGIVPLGIRIVSGIELEVEVVSHLDRVSRLIEYLIGLLGEFGPSAGEWTDIL